jgi:hypothetical protein
MENLRKTESKRNLEIKSPFSQKTQWKATPAE